MSAKTGSKSNRWLPPGYESLVAAILKEHAGGKKGRFAALTGLTIDEVNRWVGGFPSNHESMVRWANALGLPWQALVTAEDASAAAEARPHFVKRPRPPELRAAAPNTRQGRGAR